MDPCGPLAFELLMKRILCSSAKHTAHTHIIYSLLGLIDIHIQVYKTVEYFSSMCSQTCTHRLLFRILSSETSGQSNTVNNINIIPPTSQAAKHKHVNSPWNHQPSITSFKGNLPFCTDQISNMSTETANTKKGQSHF